MDLNLILVLSILVRESSVRKTAEIMHVGSPSISMSLNKLRETFNDPLMVRRGRGMVPTPRALELVKKINPFLQELRISLIQPKQFDPFTIERTLRFAIAEDLETLFLPEIYRQLSLAAPKVKLLIRDVDFNSIGDDLKSGEFEVVLAALFPPNIKDEPCRLVYRENFKVLYSRQYHRFVDDISLEEYISVPHLLISPRGHTQGSIDPVLAQYGIKRNVISTLTKFSSLPPILEKNAVICNVPSAIGVHYQQAFNLALCPLPLPSPEFDIGLAWQHALDQDAFTQWFIELVIRIISDKSKSL